MTHRFLHLGCDNSARHSDPTHPMWRDGGTGWRGWYDWAMPTMDRLGCGLMCRQPIPGVLRDPLLGDGWLTCRKIFRDKYISTMNKVGRVTGRPVVIYTGLIRDQEDGWGDDHPERPYPEPPKFKHAREHSFNYYQDQLDRAMSPHLRVKNSWIFFDGSSFTPAESVAFKYMDMLRVGLADEGRYVGVESPPDLGKHPRFRPFAVSATWNSFENRVKSLRWGGYPSPRIVLAQTNYPDGLYERERGDIGGKSLLWHRLMASRCVKIIDCGGIPALPLQAVARSVGNFDKWLEQYGAAA